MLKTVTWLRKKEIYYRGDIDSHAFAILTRSEASCRTLIRCSWMKASCLILVCTDAAAEGLNLQTADLLVNFDLGWNPMKVEQRVSRIDRIGQKHKDIYVLNLCYADNAKYVVYGHLLKRLADANMIVGTQQFSLLSAGPEDFQALAEGSITPEALEIRRGNGWKSNAATWSG